MAAYAALLSLSQTTDLNRAHENSLFDSDAEEKVRSIHDYVNFLLLFFEEFPDKVNRWEVRIRDVAYKIEDIIEIRMWQRIQSRHAAMNPSRVKLEDQLENVKQEIGLLAGEVMEERPAYLPASSYSSRIAAVGSDAVIGLDEDLMAMKDRLCGLSSKLQVIPIVGMGGIGKTTLARTIYNDPLIMRHFDFRAWVVVSQDYCPHKFRKILLDSMKLLGQHLSGDELDASEIGLRVYKNLKGRRYLIVIDDVWGTHVWDDAKFIFPDDDNGSRIVLTTRQLDVATYPYSAAPKHEMRFMDDSQSWDLLKGKVFANSDCPRELEDVGKEIAQRCAGLPLAIVLVGGVLSLVSKTRVSWEEITKNVNPIAGRELEEILSLSYTHLPHYLRPCFLFIGGFQDINIYTSRLFRLWVAEGFLKHQNGCSKTLEEKAEEYLEDLVKRNLVIVTSRKSDGKIKSCNLHDMVRGLCIRKAQEEKFLHVMDGHDLPRCLMNERHITFSGFDTDKIWGRPTFRTILCFQFQNSPSWITLLESCKLLRVLDALGVDLKELPSEVFQLYHLRYLALIGSSSIPSAISNLVNLQTLIIQPTFRKQWGKNDDVDSLPVEIWRLPKLRHLCFYIPYMLPHPPEELNIPLENLQTLMLVANLVWNEKILQLIPNVKRLGLSYTLSEEYHLHHLNDLHQLEKLEVIGGLSFSWSGQNLSLPCTLKKLILVGGGFPWKDMLIVGLLPNLEVLKLLGNACNGETWETTDEDFPQLKCLLIEESHLRQWITQSNPLPRLKRLVLRSCWYLREIPEGIGEIPPLELIEVDSCTISLVESANKIKEDQESYGNCALQVRVGHEEIQSWLESFYKGMDLSPSRSATSGNDAVIGLGSDLIAIKERLCGQSSKLQVIPIVGMGGIGKTTLARTLYDDPSILEHFEIRAWLTLSLDCSPLRYRKILLGLLNSMELLDEQMSGNKINESEMAMEIYRNLKGRRYLIVIDDVWSRDVWYCFKRLFFDYGNGSRIIVTTRLDDVGFYANSGIFLHRMQFMDDYQSWDLFKQKVFKHRNCPPYLEEVGKEIAQRCGGLPLAVVLIAGIMPSVDTTRASWNEIAKNINVDVGPKFENILSLSFTCLPNHLRPCFLYMGFFPEAERIHASKLIKNWIEKGFLKHEIGCYKSLKEEAKGYLEDLVKRNLVTVTSRKSDGKIESCILHGMVRDLCIRKSHDEKFLMLWLDSMAW